MLKESREAADIPTGAEDPLRFGIGAIRASLQQIVSNAVQQGLIPRPMSPDELFEDAARILGSEAE